MKVPKVNPAARLSAILGKDKTGAKPKKVSNIIKQKMRPNIKKK